MLPVSARGACRCVLRERMPKERSQWCGEIVFPTISLKESGGSCGGPQHWACLWRRLKLLRNRPPSDTFWGGSSCTAAKQCSPCCPCPSVDSDRLIMNSRPAGASSQERLQHLLASFQGEATERFVQLRQGDTLSAICLLDLPLDDGHCTPSMHSRTLNYLARLQALTSAMNN